MFYWFNMYSDRNEYDHGCYGSVYYTENINIGIQELCFIQWLFWYALPKSLWKSHATQGLSFSTSEIRDSDK